MFEMAPTVNPYSTGFDVSDVAMNVAFPVVDPEFKPFGAKVMIQVRRVMTKTKSGIVLPGASKETEAYNMQVGKIIDCGPLAFKNRATGQEWPEGMWANIGDFVRFPRHIGDRLTVPLDDGMGEPVVILILDDHQLMGKYTGNPLKVRTYIE